MTRAEDLGFARGLKARNEFKDDEEKNVGAALNLCAVEGIWQAMLQSEVKGFKGADEEEIMQESELLEKLETAGAAMVARTSMTRDAHAFDLHSSNVQNTFVRLEKTLKLVKLDAILPHEALNTNND